MVTIPTTLCRRDEPDRTTATAWTVIHRSPADYPATEALEQRAKLFGVGQTASAPRAEVHNAGAYIGEHVVPTRGKRLSDLRKERRGRESLTRWIDAPPRFQHCHDLVLV